MAKNLHPDVINALKPRSNRYISHLCPHPKQAVFMLLPQKEILFGGAAGPGKSYALVLSALQYFDVPGYSAVLFRRTSPQLTGEGGLIPKAHEILAGQADATWSEQKKTYTSKEGGVIKFAHLQYDKTALDHDGMEYQLIAFDELPHFSLYQYLFLMSRLRRPRRLRIPLRVRSTGNPGGPGHEWVKARLVDNVEKKNSRLYIPATLKDNPSLNTEEYIEQLMMLPPLERAQKLHGDWDAAPDGEIFKDRHFKRYDTDPSRLVHTMDRVILSWDCKNAIDTRKVAKKGESWAVGQVWGQKGSNVYLLGEVRGLWGGDDTIKQFQIQCDVWPMARRKLVEKKAAGVYLIKRLKDVVSGIVPINPEGTKAARGEAITPFCDAGNVWVPNEILNPWVKEWLHEVLQFPAVPNDRGDAMTQAVEELLGRSAVSIPDLPTITPLYTPTAAW